MNLKTYYSQSWFYKSRYLSNQAPIDIEFPVIQISVYSKVVDIVFIKPINVQLHNAFFHEYDALFSYITYRSTNKNIVWTYPWWSRTGIQQSSLAYWNPRGRPERGCMRHWRRPWTQSQRPRYMRWSPSRCLWRSGPATAGDGWTEAVAGTWGWRWIALRSRTSYGTIGRREKDEYIKINFSFQPRDVLKQECVEPAMYRCHSRHQRTYFNVLMSPGFSQKHVWNRAKTNRVIKTF